MYNTRSAPPLQAPSSRHAPNHETFGTYSQKHFSQTGFSGICGLDVHLYAHTDSRSSVGPYLENPGRYNQADRTKNTISPLTQIDVSGRQFGVVVPVGY